jgi:hypothetical protein
VRAGEWTGVDPRGQFAAAGALSPLRPGTAEPSIKGTWLHTASHRLAALDPSQNRYD